MVEERGILSEYGWDARLQDAFAEVALEGDFPGRIFTFNRHLYQVMTATGEATALLPGALRRAATTPEALPAVGDWVVLRPQTGDDRPTIRAVLPRKSRFLRRAAGLAVEQQVVAANIDTVFIVTGLTSDFSLRRIERYLTMAWESGAQPVIVLNKTDQVSDAPAKVAAVEGIAPGVPVLAISALTGEGLGEVATFVGPGRTVALLGSSGAGKSTIANRLLGTEAQRTGDVRLFDGKGRHTTTQRQTFVIPGGGLLVDNPGIREIQLWHADEALEEVFADVEELAARCRFADCSHGSEPGCRVREAVEEGNLEAGRYESYLKQRRELAFLATREDRTASQNTKRRWKAITKAFNKVTRP